MSTAKPSQPRGRARRPAREPLVTSTAVERETRKLRATRYELKERPTAEDTDIRDTLV